MNVLSLFDGISCGQQALKELGIPVEKYYASEVDPICRKEIDGVVCGGTTTNFVSQTKTKCDKCGKLTTQHPITITQYHFPNTIQLGDVTKWREWGIDWASIDLLQGGSPCQGFSFAGKQLNFDDPRSKLFFEFVDILNHIKKHNPNVKFLLENVRMKKEYQNVISEQLGVQPVMINSALVSAQNRVRLYWTNVGEIQQPEDKGILLKDVLEEDGTTVKDKGQTILATIYKENVKSMVKRNKLGLCCQVGSANLKGHDSIKRVYSPQGKSPTLTTMGGGHREPKVEVRVKPRGNNKGSIQEREKSPSITTSSFEHNVHVREKSKCVRSSGLGSYDRHEWDSVGNKGTELYWRKLTPLECERLQTLPDQYTAHGNYDGEVKEVANTNRYKALGNGWTVEVIKHIYRALQL